jgi:signal transduction histidine kinase
MPNKKPNTNRKKALSSTGPIKDSEALNALTLANNAAYSWLKTVESGAYEFSGNIKAVTGYTSEEINLLSGKYFSLIHKEDFEDFKIRYFDFLENSPDNDLYLEYRICAKDNSVFWISEHISAKRDKDNKAVELRGFSFKNDALKMRELALQEEVSDLKRKNTAKDNFFSIISHDLRSPFTSIIGFAEILINEPKLSEEERQEFLKYIYESAQLQLKLINNLLDWSRIESGRVNVELTRISVKYTLANIISGLTGDAVRKNIEIIAKIEPHLFVKADEVLLDKVLFNLLENAIKYSYESSKIEITARYFNKDNVEIIFKDSGKGISEENTPNIFTLDKKYNTTGTKGEKGTGTGLILVKKIVQLLNGDVWFYSAQNKGSEFHVILPQIIDSIFIIEENEEDKDFLVKFFNKEYHNFNVYSFNSGYEAISKASGVSPIAVIVNHNLTLLNGVAFIKEFKLLTQGRKILFLPVLDENSEEFVKDYAALGIKTIIRKPYIADSLKSAIRQLIG